MTEAVARRRVVGRFAPTPSGPLHLGSLLAAVGSWLDAHHAAGEWLLRIDDLDLPRCRPQHERSLRDALEAHALRPDRPPTRQSTDLAPYHAALRHLADRGLLFRCRCSRRELAEASAVDGGAEESCCLRDCHDRDRIDADGLETALRTAPHASESALRVDLRGFAARQVMDRSLGPIAFDPHRHRDLVLRRRDGIVAYALAVVVDDHAAGVTDVVRGGDLLSGTPWQLALHTALGLPEPRYLHLPVVTEADGSKLAKSRHSVPLDPAIAPQNLVTVLGWLGQALPAEATKKSAAELLAAAALDWDPARFAGRAEIRLSADRGPSSTGAHGPGDPPRAP